MILAELTLPAQPDQVWRHLREPALISRWFGWEYDGLDDEITQIYSTAEADPEALTLKLGNGDRFSLREQDGKTVVRIDRPAKSADDDWYDDITEGWTTFLQLLRFAVEHHGLAERKTIYLDACATVMIKSITRACKACGLSSTNTEPQPTIMESLPLLLRSYP